jgi:hypothetical protein
MIPKRKTTPREAYFMLVSDTLLLCTSRRQKIRVYDRLPLRVVKFTNVADCEGTVMRIAMHQDLVEFGSVLTLAATELLNAIQLSVIEYTWTMMFASAQEKDKWWTKMTQLQESLLVDDLCARGNTLSICMCCYY